MLSRAKNITERIQEVAPEAYCPEASNHFLLPTQFIRPAPPLTISHFQCGVCYKVLNGPVELFCNHLFCKVCFLEHVTSGNYDCPTCHKPLTDMENIKCPSPTVADPEGFRGNPLLLTLHLCYTAVQCFTSKVVSLDTARNFRTSQLLKKLVQYSVIASGIRHYVVKKTSELLN